MSPWTCSSSSEPTSPPTASPRGRTTSSRVPFGRGPAGGDRRHPRHGSRATSAVVGHRRRRTSPRMLRQAGLPTELHTDEDVSGRKDLTGVEVVPLDRPRGRRWRSPTRSSTSSATPRWCASTGSGRDLPCPLLGKLEFLNPGGSVKDRPGRRDDRGGRARRAAQAGIDHRRGHLGQHRRRARDRRRPASLPLRLRHARQDGPGEDRAAARLRRRGRPVPVGGGARPPRVVLLGDGAPRRGDPRRLSPRPVPQPREPGRPREDDRPGDLAPDRRAGHPLRRRHRHGRDHLRHRPLPQVAEPATSRSSAPTPRARSTRAARAGPTSSRGSARTSGRPPTTRRSSTGS